MRLYAEHPEQETGNDRPPVDEEGRCSEQPGGQKPVLSEADRPEDRRKGQKRHQGCPTALTDNPVHDEQIEAKCRYLEHHER